MKEHRVLVPVDGSEFGLQIFPYLMRFLDPAKSEIVLLRVAPRPQRVEVGGPGDPLTIYPVQREQSMEANFYSEMLPYMRDLANAGFTVSTAMCFGDPAHQINRFISEELIDLVAMTTHGRTGLARLLLGSVAQEVLLHAGVPVLLYRPTLQAESLDEPVSLTEVEPDAAIEAAGATPS